MVPQPEAREKAGSDYKGGPVIGTAVADIEPHTTEECEGEAGQRRTAKERHTIGAAKKKEGATKEKRGRERERENNRKGTRENRSHKDNDQEKKESKLSGRQQARLKQQ